MLGALQNLITELHQHVWLGGYLLALSAGQADDTLAERLRRRPAKPMGSPRVGSNPTGVVSCQLAAMPQT
mgnify:CR=1 FL=1